MKKCASIGMNVDFYESSSKPSIICSKSFISSSDGFSDHKISNLKSEIFIEQIKKFLSKEPEFIPKIGIKLNEMQRFQLGLTRLLDFSWPLKNVKIVQEIVPSEKEKLLEFYSQYFGYLAELVACSELILKLTTDERVKKFIRGRGFF